METTEVDALVRQLVTGFEALQTEYQKLFGQYQGLERKLATAREQYNELAKLCDSGSVTTPPLSLTSSPAQRNSELSTAQSVSTLLEQRPDPSSREAGETVTRAVSAATILQTRIKSSSANPGVRIWSGPSADRLEYGSSMMPSISESPLEQDFTVEGKPSQLGCPFASMANKKLSSHAASVLSRYNQGSSTPRSRTGDDAATSLRSGVSRVNGRESLARKTANERRASLADPIKAEICGLDSHHAEQTEGNKYEATFSEDSASKCQAEPQQEAGVCPIRFLDQHSPEEVATYFERHKHELPRSHEVCVKRYQSNEKQIRELDAKYGNLVSMIQGLGEKHQNYLPKEPDAEEIDAKEENVEDDANRDEKVRKWASSVSAQAGQDDGEVEEERTPHFERPMRDVRVGESPSRPWGISIPVKYVEEAAARTDASSSPVKLRHAGVEAETDAGEKAGRCPFGFDQEDAPTVEAKIPQQDESPAQAVFIAPDRTKQNAPGQDAAATRQDDDGSKMVFTGPVFVGYSAEDAATILRESGLGRPS